MPDLAALAAALRQGEAITIAGALFDMDGTLVDSIPAVEEAWAIWAEEHGVAAPSSSLHGKTARAVILASSLDAADHGAAEARLAEIESRPGQHLASLPGARQLLSSLPAGRWGVVTSAARSVALARFSATDLPEPAFRVTGDDVTHGKPAPDPFLAGTRHLRDAGHIGMVIAFEDTIAGATSAASAGCFVFGVLGTDPREMLETQTHVVLDSLESVCVVSDGTELRIRLN